MKNKLSYSQLQKYINCPLSYFYNYVIGIRPIEESTESHHSAWGSAIHLGLETYYKGGGWEDIRSAFLKEYPVQLDTEDNVKTIDNGIRLLEEYIKYYKNLDKNYKVLATEVLDEFEVDGVKFVAKMDLVLEDMVSGGIYGMDHKTTSKSLSYKYFNQFDPNSQIDLYYIYFQQKFGDCSGIYINAMQAGFRQRKYKGEPAGFHCKFDRYLINRNKEQLLIQKTDVRYWRNRILDDEKCGVFGRNTSGCNWCEYRPICSAGWNWEQDKDLILLQYRYKEDAINDAESSNKEVTQCQQDQS